MTNIKTPNENYQLLRMASEIALAVLKKQSPCFELSLNTFTDMISFNQLRFSVLVLAGIAILTSCGSGNSSAPANKTEEKVAVTPVVDMNNTGIGKFSKVDIPAEINNTMADSGKTVYTQKCIACHKLSNEKFVGPGWNGLTKRRRAEWILNYITNTEEMLQKDPLAQAQLEQFKTPMPDQKLTDQEARNVYEFMRRNDAAN
jgi:cytochrome c2